MRSSFVQHAKNRKEDIQVVGIVNDVMINKIPLPRVIVMAGDWIRKLFDQKELQIKTYSVMSFNFNAVE